LTKASELPNANVISRTLQAIAKPVTPGVLGPLCLASHYEYTLPIEARNPGQVWRQVAPADFNLDQLVEFLFSEQGLRHANKEVAYAASRSLASLCRADPFSVVPAILPFFQRALDPSPLSGLSAAELGVLSDPDGTLTAAGSFKFVVPEVDARNLNINTRGLARLRRAPDADDEPDRVEAPKPVPAAQPKAAAAAVKGQAGKGKGAEPAKGKAAGKDTPEQIAARAAAEEKLRKQDGLRAHVRVIVEQKRQALTAFESCVSASSDFFSKAMATLLPALLKLRWSYGVPNEAAHAIAIAVQHIEPRVRPLAGDITELLLHLREQNETLAPVLTSLFHELNEQATEHFQPGTFSLIFPLIAFALQNTDLLEVQQAAMILLEQHSEQPGALPRQQMTTVLVSLIGTQSRFQEAAETAMSQMHGNFKAVDLSDLMSCYLVEFPQQRRVVLEAGQSVLQRTLEVASPHIFYLATFDTENADLAKEICEEFQIVASPAYKDPFLALLAHPLFPMRNLAGKALSRLCATHPEISSSVVERTLASYRNNLPPKVDPKDPRSFQPEFLANLEQPHMLIARSGVAALIHHFGVQAKGTLASSAPGGLLRTLLRFLTNEGLGEAHTDIYRQMLEAGVELVKLNSSETSVILSILEDTLARTEKSKDPASLAVYDQIQGASVVLLGTLAAFLDPSSPSIDPIVTRLLQALHSNAESTQKAVSACFVPLMRQTLLGRAPDLLKQLVSEVLDTPSERDRRGAAHGLAGMIKGLGSSALDKYGVIGAINGALQNKRVAHARQGALWAIELFCMRLGRPFERFVPGLLPRLLSCFGDQVEAVRATAFDTSRAIMAILSPYGVQLVLPVIMKSLKDKNWRKQVGSIDLLASMSACAPKQLSFSLPAIVPKLCTCLMDTMAEISTAAKSALRRISVVITNHEIKRHIPVILQALNEPEQHTRSGFLL
jgi:hypothetical protein